MARCKYFFQSVKSRDFAHLVNQDYMLQSRFTVMNDTGIDVVVVADGIGGLADGNIASHVASTTFVKNLYNEILEIYVPQRKYFTLTHYCDELKRAMIRAFEAANKSVLAAASPGVRMGTTLSAAVILGDYMIVGNVGDSPVYYYEKETNTMKQVADLQTQAEEDVRAGRYKRYSEEYFHNDYILTHYMGQYEKIPEEIISFYIKERIQQGDELLLVSDGAVGKMLPDEIHELLLSDEEEYALSILFSEAEKDKYDDQTACWIKFM